MFRPVLRISVSAFVVTVLVTSFFHLRWYLNNAPIQGVEAPPMVTAIVSTLGAGLLALFLVWMPSEKSNSARTSAIVLLCTIAGFMTFSIVPSGSASILQRAAWSLSFTWPFAIVFFSTLFPRRLDASDIIARRPAGNDMGRRSWARASLLRIQRTVVARRQALVLGAALWALLVFVNTTIGERQNRRPPGLGVVMADTADALPGTLLNAVMPGSPAYTAGLQAGDLVTHLDGRSLLDSVWVDVTGAAVTTPRGRLVDFVSTLDSGRPVEVTYTRAGVSASAEVVVREWSILVFFLAGLGFFGFSLVTYPTVMTGAVALSASLLWTGYSCSDAGGRQQVLWILWGVSAAAVLLCLEAVLLFGYVYSELSVFAVVAVAAPWLEVAIGAVILGGFAAAMFAFGAFDVRPVITRTTVYGALGVLFVLGFSVLESLVSELIEARLALPGFVGAAVAGAIVAGALIPFRSRLSKRIARLLEP